jgi:hypothetical protein
MPNIIQQESSCEIIVKPLIEATQTDSWQNALEILFISGHVISFSQDAYNFPCLISAKGPIEKTEKSLDLLKGKGNVAIKPLISKTAKIFLPKILMMAQLPEDSDSVGQVGLVLTHIIPEMEKHQKEIGQIIMQGALAVPDLIAPSIFNNLMESRENHLHCCLDADLYEEMIVSLHQFEIIQSIVQVSICPDCANYQLILSKNPIKTSHCPKCGSEWASITLYTFENSFAKIKYDNSDIALFISSYLRFKLENDSFLDDIKILPNVVYKTDSGKDAEIDVHLPEFNIGIECKIFEDAYAPMTSARISSITDTLSKQLANYHEVNIEEVLLVTNLTTPACEKLRKDLNSKLKKKKISLKIKVVPGDYVELLDELDEIITNISKKTSPLFIKAGVSVNQIEK